MPETVLEVKTTGLMTFHLDMEDGSNPQEAIEELVEKVDGIRHIDFEIEEVYPIEEY